MNIQPAQRVQEVSEYYFSQKLREIAERNAKGEDIISLGIGSPDLPPGKEVVETLAESAQEAGNHGYQSYVGIPELRRSMADWYNRFYGVELNPNSEILPLIGSKEGILHLSMALLNVGDGVLVPNPGYPTYGSVSRLIGASVQTYDLTEANDWLPDFEQLEQMDLSNVKLMWVNYPNMPTGRRATLGVFEQLVAFGRRHNIVICNDNPYSFILNDRPLSIFNVEGAKDICIEFNSLSKSQNMPGWRIGMMVGRKEFVDWTLRFKSNIDSGMFKPMQLAAAKSLEATEEWYRGMNAVYAERREVAERIMTAIGCQFDPQQSGMFLWGRIPDALDQATTLTDRVLNEARVFIVPGMIFGSNGQRYVRISLCATREKLEQALARINESKL